MNVLRKLTGQNLKLNRKRTIVTIIGIILSAAMVTGVATLVASFQDLFIQSAKMTDGSHHASFYGVPYENSKYIQDHAYTQTAMLSKDLGFARLESSESVAKPYWMIKSYDAESFEHLPVTLKEGRFPEREGEIVISEGVLYDTGMEYKIGESFSVDIGERVDQGEFLTQQEPLSETEELETFTTETYTVTGIITRPRFEAYDAPGYTAIAYLDESRLSAEDKVNISIVAVDPERIFDQAPELAEVAEAEEISYNNELLKWMGITQNEGTLKAMRSVGLIILLLVVTGSVTVIYNAFAISVNERKKQFGMLASVGATKKQIRKMVFWEGFLLGLIAIPIGVSAGVAGIGITLKVVNQLMRGSVFNTGASLRLIISYETIAVSVLFIALTIFLSVYLPARRAAKVSPIEAIRQTQDIHVKQKTLKTSRLTRLLFGIEGELALKNLKRNKRRYRATLFSLLISIVLYISFSSFMTYGFISSDIYYQDVAHDFEIEKQDVSTEEAAEFYKQVARLDEVERYSLVRNIFSEAVELERKQLGDYLRGYLDKEEGEVLRTADGGYRLGFSLIAVGEEEFAAYARELGLEVADYTNSEQIRGILINRNVIPGTADYTPLNMKAGEKVTLTDPAAQGNETPFEYTLEIGAVTEQLPFGVQYAQFLESVNVIVSETVFDDLCAQLSAPSQETAQHIRMFAGLQEDVDRQQFKEHVKAIDARLHSGGHLMMFDIEEFVNEIKNTKTMISIFLYGFVALITLIGVTNIFNTISTNVALRRREFAMLKSVGLTPAGFNKMINYESIFYGLKALLYGLPLGILVNVLMYRSVNHAFDFAFAIPWKEMIICIIGVFVIVFITMLHASSRLKKENIGDALREENL